MTMNQCLAGAAILLATGLSVQAAGRGAVAGRGGRGGAVAMQHSATETAEVAALRPAFTTLLGADHDYEGHRVRAMVAIAEACRLLGTDIVPPGLKERLENAGNGVKDTESKTKPAVKPTDKPAAAERHATKEPETQSVSDQQLKDAQNIVQQVRSGIAAGTQPRVSALLDKAIAEIGTALAVK